jgi:hypothetical protein
MELKAYPGALASIDFKVQAYVTARPIDSRISLAWLNANGFPDSVKGVFTVPEGTPKSDALLHAGVNVFVDDRPENFDEINEAGYGGFVMRCLLLDRPWNRTHEAGPWRIKSLKEINPLIGRPAEPAPSVLPTEPPPPIGRA